MNKLVCPHCGDEFKKDDVYEFEKHQASYILNKHGMSYRAIARLFGWGSPESVRIRIDIYKKIKNIE